MNWLAHVEESARRLLCCRSGFLDHLHIWHGTAIADRRLVRVHLDDGVIHSHRAQGGKHVLDRMHPDRPFADRGGAFDHLQVGDVRVNGRLIRQIFAFEFDPMIDWGRLQLERHLFARVQRGAAESGRFRKRMLKLGSHRALTNKELARLLVAVHFNSNWPQSNAIILAMPPTSIWRTFVPLLRKTITLLLSRPAANDTLFASWGFATVTNGRPSIVCK